MVETRDHITLSGRDYMGKLMDVTALESYSNTETGAIVTDLASKYLVGTGITTTNVQNSGKTLTQITFKRKPVFDCILELSQMASMDYYIDETKDLHYEKPGSIDSGVTLDNSNSTAASLITDTSEMYNSVWVYGGRYLSGWRNTFTGDGAGSVFTLDYRPRDALVLVSGAVKRGHIFSYTLGDAPSGVQYVIDFVNQKLIFVSGTNNGNNLPGSLVTIQADYQRQLPVVKLAQDSASIAAYGQRDTFISNDEIVDPRHAEDIAKSELSKYHLPQRQGVVQVVSSTITNVQIGRLVTMNHPDLNVSSERFSVIAADWRIDKDTLQGNRVLTLRLHNRLKNIVDVMADFQAQLQELQARNADTADVITRLQIAPGSIGHRSTWYVRTRAVNDSFILSSTTNARLGTDALGDRRGALSLQYSGGYFP